MSETGHVDEYPALKTEGLGLSLDMTQDHGQSLEDSDQEIHTYSDSAPMDLGGEAKPEAEEELEVATGDEEFDLNAVGDGDIQDDAGAELATDVGNENEHYSNENDDEYTEDPALANEDSGKPAASSSYENDDNIYAMQAHRIEELPENITQKKNIRKPRNPMLEGVFAGATAGGSQGSHIPLALSESSPYSNESTQERKRRLLEEAMDQAIKNKSVRRRKADEDDLERMQDDKIDYLKDQMIKAANMDVEKNSQGQIATEKLKLLREVMDVLLRADLAISILDNNLLEAVRLWLEPLPDASMPAYQIQKELIAALETLPIKTDHLVASGIGKVLVFYQRLRRTEPRLKKVVDRLIGDWTRPILNKSDSYKDRLIMFNEYNKSKYSNQLASARSANRPQEAKTLYEENATRRKRAAIPLARTAAYKIAPRVDASLLRRQQQISNGTGDERFRRINAKLTSMLFKKKAKKTGPSIEGKNLTI